MGGVDPGLVERNRAPVPERTLKVETEVARCGLGNQSPEVVGPATVQWMKGGLDGIRWRGLLAIAALSVGMAGCSASAQKSQRSFVGYSFITTPQGKPYPVDLTTGQAQSPSVICRTIHLGSST